MEDVLDVAHLEKYLVDDQAVNVAVVDHDEALLARVEVEDAVAAAVDDDGVPMRRPFGTVRREMEVVQQP